MPHVGGDLKIPKSGQTQGGGLSVGGSNGWGNWWKKYMKLNKKMYLKKLPECAVFVCFQRVGDVDFRS